MINKRGHLGEATYEAIRKRILSGGFYPAQHLVEAALTEELDTSKTPVREALARLEEEGLVEWFPYRGYFVRALSQEDIREIYELRELFEGACARVCAESSNNSEIAGMLRSENDAAARAFAETRMDLVHTHFARFDEIVFGQTRKKRLREYVDRILDLVTLSGIITNWIPGRIEHSLDEHRDIIAAIAAGDVVGAEEATRRHIRSLLEVQTPVRLERRLAWPL